MSVSVSRQFSVLVGTVALVVLVASGRLHTRPTMSGHASTFGRFCPSPVNTPTS